MLGSISKSVSVVFLIFCLNSVYSQDIDYSEFEGEPFTAGINLRLEKPYFKEYGYAVLDQYVLLPTANKAELEGRPEMVLCNAILANSQSELLNYFVEDTVKIEDYKRPTDSISSSNFFLLRHKLSFTKNRNELVIIKYTQFVDSMAVQDFSIQCIKYENENTWKGTKREDINHIEYALRNITSREFWSLVKFRKLDQDDLFLPEELRQDLKDDEGILNIYKLTDYLKSRKSEGKPGLVD